MIDDKHARDLLDRAARIQIYRQLNPWDLSFRGDNCPAAAEALFRFLSPQPGQATSITQALPPNEHGFVFQPGVTFRPASLSAIIEMVRGQQPGFVVVVHGVRPANAIVNGRRMAPDHYFCIVKLGPPQNDVFWTDASRPEYAMFYPSRRSTPPGNWENTIEGMAQVNRLNRFEYTTGPYSVREAPGR
jgi:hypothetical protein